MEVEKLSPIGVKSSSLEDQDDDANANDQIEESVSVGNDEGVDNAVEQMEAGNGKDEELQCSSHSKELGDFDVKIKGKEESKKKGIAQAKSIDDVPTKKPMDATCENIVGAYAAIDNNIDQPKLKKDDTSTATDMMELEQRVLLKKILEEDTETLRGDCESGNANSAPKDVNNNATFAIHENSVTESSSASAVSRAETSMLSQPGAFAIENPMHESSIRQEILAANNDNETSSDELAPTAPVVLASQSTMQIQQGSQDDDNPDTLGSHHFLEAVCVEDQKIVEATIVLNDGRQDSSGQCSVRMRYSLVVAVALLVAMIVALCLVITQRNDNNSNQINNAVPPQPTKEYPMDVYNKTKEDRLLEILAPLGRKHTNHERLDRTNAFTWLLADELLPYDDPDIEWKIRQRYVLALFYFAASGANWNEQFYFLSGLDECDWSAVSTTGQQFGFPGAFNIKGVVCNRIGRVERISMWWNNLSGTLPRELVEFSNSLIEISLGGGSIGGNIPSSFEEMQYLEVLDLHDNCLWGSIPDFSAIPTLQTILISNNDGLYGSLNSYCNGTEKVDPSLTLAADCDYGESSMECDCCNLCCTPDIHECCSQDEACWSSINGLALTPDNFLSSFNKVCLSEASKEWIREECPCIINKYADDSSSAPEEFEAVCTKDCDAEGASRSYDF